MDIQIEFVVEEKTLSNKTQNDAIWNNGTFNGGQFIDSAIWKDGIFNGGKFLSNYGFNNGVSIGPDDVAPNNKEEYSWEYGIFNGGEFGNANTATNSNWFDGEFNGGQFKGRNWNKGVFSFGEFLGSGGAAIGGTASILSQSNPNLFVKSYNGNPKQYYGLWRDGYVTDIKDKYITDKKLYTDIKRANDTTKVVNKATLKNMLWMNGTFTHPSGEMINSVWLDGIFENGQFLSSSFNPYVNRNNVNTFNFSDTCSWKNGIFDGGEFNISTWDNGTFISGTATGMIWKNGVANYMNAYNVFWQDGLWRNGNWNGSYFNLNADGSVVDDYVLQILNNGMPLGVTSSSVHVWNIFYDESLTDVNTLTLEGVTDFEFIAGTATDSPPTWSSGSTFSSGSTIPTTPITPITPSTCGVISIIGGEGYGAYTNYDYLKGAIEITNNTSYNAATNGWVMVYDIRTSGLPTNVNGVPVPIYGSRTGRHGKGTPTIQIGNSTPVGLSQPSINFGIGYQNGSNPVVQIAFYTLPSGTSGQVYYLPYLPASYTLVINITSN